ncbi:MAG TPA: hemerythrin domain-containing protein [Kineosporiaceae bacterium]|nr:hemerythrin domain-containing protein [Kineosporiaceae bacterium]
MCEYCGCQQIAAIDLLTREHDALVAAMSIARVQLTTGDLDEAAATCRGMLDLLGPHTLVEEEGLFPELADEFPSHVAALRAEHAEIEHVLAESRFGVPDDPTWPERLTTTFFQLREHILKEQDGMFPAALAALDSEQWERVEAVRVRAGDPLMNRNSPPES